MTPINIDQRIEDGEWAAYIENEETLQHGVIERVGLLPEGTVDGKDAFQLLARLDDGSQVIVETTWALMSIALTALQAGQERNL